LFGVSELQDKVLAKEGDPDIRVYLAWVPMFRGMERDVPRASQTMPDPRTSHYWDGDSLLGKGYRKTLDLSEDAWDIFLLYGPDARWEGDEPPAPRFWMHQLGSARRPRLNGPYLDAKLFLQALRSIGGR
jgi:hypothetical protein